MAVMGISSVSFGKGIVGNSPSDILEKTRKTAEKRRIVRQEIRIKELKEKMNSGEELTPAEKTELAEYKLEKTLEALAEMGKGTVIYASA